MKRVFAASLLVTFVGFVGSCVLLLSQIGTRSVHYTVVNDTDQPLVTWVIDNDCARLIGYRGTNYTPGGELPPRQSTEIDALGTSDGCIQVVTRDRLIVYVRPYEEGATATVSEPLQILGGPVPNDDEDLPKGPSETESITSIFHAGRSEWIEAALLLTFAIGLLGILMASAVGGIRAVSRVTFGHLAKARNR